MLPHSHKFLCTCGCGVPIAELDGNRLIFRKRVGGVWHVLVLVLPLEALVHSYYENANLDKSDSVAYPG